MDQLDIKNVVGHKIRELRIKKGLSQKQLSEGIMTVAALSYIENGKNKPTAYNLTQLADRLGVDSTELIGSPEDLGFNFDVIKMYVRSRNYSGVLALVDQLTMEGLTSHQEALLSIYKAEAIMHSGSLESAAEILLPLAERIKDEFRNQPGVLVPLLNNLGSYYFLRHDWVNAYVHYREAFLHAATPEVDTFYYARIVYNLGNTCRLNGFYKESLEYLDHAQTLFRSVYSENDPRAIYAAALSLKGLGKMDQAKKMISQAIAYFEGQSNFEYLQKARLQYAFDILSSSDLQAALTELVDVKRSFSLRGDHTMTIFTCAKMMLLEIRSGSLESALRLLSESTTLLAQIEAASDYLAYWYRISARVSFRSGDIELAASYAKRSVELYRSFHLEKEVAESLEVLAEILESSGEYTALIGVQKQIIDALRISRIGG